MFVHKITLLVYTVSSLIAASSAHLIPRSDSSYSALGKDELKRIYQNNEATAPASLMQAIGNCKFSITKVRNPLSKGQYTRLGGEPKIDGKLAGYHIETGTSSSKDTCIHFTGKSVIKTHFHHFIILIGYD